MPEGTASPGAPPLQPLPPEKRLTKPATGRTAAMRPAEPVPPAASPAANLNGTWEVELQFVSGRAHHTLVFDSATGARLKGLHVGSQAKGRLTGKVDGSKVQFQSTLPVEGMRLNYRFSGTIQGDQLTGEVELAEFGKAKWIAKRMV